LTKAERISQLKTRRDKYQATLDEIVENKVHSFGKGNFHTQTLQIDKLQTQIDAIEAKITAWEHSSL